MLAHCKSQYFIINFFRRVLPWYCHGLS